MNLWVHEFMNLFFIERFVVMGCLFLTAFGVKRPQGASSEGRRAILVIKNDRRFLQ